MPGAGEFDDFGLEARDECAPDVGGLSFGGGEGAEGAGAGETPAVEEGVAGLRRVA